MHTTTPGVFKVRAATRLLPTHEETAMILPSVVAVAELDVVQHSEVYIRPSDTLDDTVYVPFVAWQKKHSGIHPHAFFCL